MTILLLTLNDNKRPTNSLIYRLEIVISILIIIILIIFIEPKKFDNKPNFDII